jgi:hypothetical protein
MNLADRKYLSSLLGAFLDGSVEVARSTRARKTRSLIQPIAVGATLVASNAAAAPDCTVNTCASKNECDDNTCWGGSNTCTASNICWVSNTCMTVNNCVAGNETHCAPSGNACQKSNICTGTENVCNFNSCNGTDTCTKNTCHSNACQTNTCTGDDWCTLNVCMKSDTDCGYFDVSCPVANECACGG